MPFPLLGVGKSLTAAGVLQALPTPVKFLSVNVVWNPSEVNRWPLQTEGVAVWRQMYATERAGVGGGTSAPPAWGQIWPVR